MLAESKGVQRPPRAEGKKISGTLNFMSATTSLVTFACKYWGFNGILVVLRLVRVCLIFFVHWWFCWMLVKEAATCASYNKGEATCLLFQTSGWPCAACGRVVQSCHWSMGLISRTATAVSLKANRAHGTLLVAFLLGPSLGF